MTTQGGKKQAKNNLVVKQPVVKKTRATQAKKIEQSLEQDVVGPNKKPFRDSRLESIAMIHHVHGTRTRKRLPRIFKFLKMSQIIEANWSLWHLAWSILWRMIIIVLVVRFMALFTVAYFSNLILTK